jgi:fructose-bisphosphate aldolase class I
MSNNELYSTAAALVGDGRGILAADESVATITKRFTALGIESTAETRRSYREVLFTTPGLGQYISGAILYDETIRQGKADGTTFPKVLADANIIPGIKVDTGAKPMAGHPGETITEGLDGLRERVAEYYQMGARFAKWRAVIDIAADLPTRAATVANAHALARYAALCQEGGLVPIVEPEVLMDGDHTIETCYRVTSNTLAIVFDQLVEQDIDLKGMILKPSMVIAGKKCPVQASVAKVAEMTVDCYLSRVPASVPGIALLSGGQSDQVATAHLDAMNRLGPLPWKLTFSYGRALQDAALSTWAGKADNAKAAQEALFHRSLCNSAAALGNYSDEVEKAS